MLGAKRGAGGGTVDDNLAMIGATFSWWNLRSMWVWYFFEGTSFGVKKPQKARHFGRSYLLGGGTCVSTLLYGNLVPRVGVCTCKKDTGRRAILALSSVRLGRT